MGEAAGRALIRLRVVRDRLQRSHLGRAYTRRSLIGPLSDAASRLSPASSVALVCQSQPRESKTRAGTDRSHLECSNLIAESLWTGNRHSWYQRLCLMLDGT